VERGGKGDPRCNTTRKRDELASLALEGGDGCKGRKKETAFLLSRATTFLDVPEKSLLLVVHRIVRRLRNHHSDRLRKRPAERELISQGEEEEAERRTNRAPSMTRSSRTLSKAAESNPTVSTIE
jgi:hypothetical protein